MKASNLSGTADTLPQQYMHWTFNWLGYDLSAPVFYYSLLLDVCDFHAGEIFSLGAKGMTTAVACASFTDSILSGYRTNRLRASYLRGLLVFLLIQTQRTLAPILHIPYTLQLCNTHT
jgi:hypothetical protein